MANASIQTCQDCGANVFPEHIAEKRAGHYEGRLLCAICYEEKQDAAQASASEPDSVSLVEEEVSPRSSGMSKIRALGTGTTIGAAMKAEADESKLKRQTTITKRGATRCRTFHSKLNESAIAYMNDHINEWVDDNDHVEIKFATSTVGIFEGKHADPNLIITLFY